MNKTVGNFRASLHSDGSGCNITTTLYGESTINFRAEDLADLRHLVDEMIREELRRTKHLGRAEYLEGVL